MKALVQIEIANEEVKKTSLEALVYARKTAGVDEVHAISMGSVQPSVDEISRYGANKLIHISDERLDQGIIQAHAHVLTEVIKSGGYDLFVLAKSSLSEPVAARVSVAIDASIASNIVDLPNQEDGFVVRRSIYTGKAFADVSLTRDKKILILKKNAVNLEELPQQGAAENRDIDLPDNVFKGNITGQDIAQGDVLLEEAEIVVSAGRGMKAPEHWNMIEDLAKTLKAATACSKPVSDMGWRPHHEHVGQTGIKISPNLYIAVGISGAIQHLAGVNSSKVIVVINKDPEAPFFSAADYGIVGDAFDIVPKLTEVFKKELN